MCKHKTHYEELLDEQFEKGFQEGFEKAFLQEFQKSQHAITCAQVMNLISLGYEATQIAQLLLMSESQVKEIIETGSFTSDWTTNRLRQTQ